MVAVSNAYQAAAELLSGPVAALIVDLNLLTRRHMRLLDIARQAGAEILIFGRLTGAHSSDALSGCRIVSLDRLAETLAELVRQMGPGAPVQAAGSDARSPAGDGRPLAGDGPPPASYPDSEGPADEPDDEADDVAPWASRSQAFGPQYVPAGPDDGGNGTNGDGGSPANSSDRPARPEPAASALPDSPAELLTQAELAALLASDATVEENAK